MRPLLLAFIAVAALAAAPSAALAKGAQSARVCDAAGCRTADRDTANGLFPAGRGTEPPAAAAPFATIELDLHSGPDGKTTTLAYDYLPSLGVARPHDTKFFSVPWIALISQARQSLDAALRGAVLRPAAEFPRAAGIAVPQTPQPATDDGPAWSAIAGASLAGLALLVLLARYATSALKARPRASKSSN